LKPQESSFPFSHAQDFRNRLAHLRVRLMPVETDQLVGPDTEILPAVRTWTNQKQRDMLFSTNLDSIVSQVTLPLPALKELTGQQDQANQRQVIAEAAGGAAIAGIGDLTSAILRFTTNVVMTNLVSQGIFGIYAGVYTAAILVGYITPLGLDSTVTRFLPMYRAKGEYTLAVGLLRFVMTMILILSLLAGILFFLAASVLANRVYHQGQYLIAFEEAAIIVSLSALQNVIASSLQGLKAIKWKVYTDRLIQPGLTLALTIVFYLLGLRLQALIFATICGFLTAVVTGQALLRKASNRLIGSVKPRFEAKMWLHYALPMSFNSMVLNILSSTDVLFLTVFATTAQVGLYAAPDRASTIITMPLLALNIIFSPLIAEQYARGEHTQLVTLARVVTKWSFSLSLPVFLCFLVFHEAVLSIFSKEYIAGSFVLIVLSFGNLIDAGVGSVWNLLAMTGHARVILVNTVVTIVLNIGLAFWLVPRYNVVGAAITAALTVIILNVAGFIEVSCILKILTLQWDMLKPVVAGGSASIIGILLQHVIHVGYGYQAIPQVLCLIVPFMLVYIVVLVLLRFSKEDKLLFEVVRMKFVK
jgi:O-antigen/teichoic acid export membrane protein